MARHCLIVSTLVALIGCAHSVQQPITPLPALSELRDGSPVAVGMLDFLNDHAHDRRLLDDELQLDARAARALAEHRLGPDASLGSDDDGYFFSVADVDAVTWVGPATMQRLAGHAVTNGYLATDQRVVGSFEGVSFTFAQADTTLDLVNTMSPRALDDQLHLDRRAVDSIVAARPIQSLGQLSELYWVGPATLERLRSHAVRRSVASR